VEEGGLLVEVAEGNKLFSLPFLNSKFIPFKKKQLIFDIMFILI
jgi:hypothetical protein